MKKRIRCMSKRTISVVLTLLMLVSCITVGVVQVNAYSYKSGRIYFDDTNTGWGSAYLVINYDNDSAWYEWKAMQNISGTHLYYLDVSGTSTNVHRYFFTKSSGTNGNNCAPNSNYAGSFGWDFTGGNAYFTPSGNNGSVSGEYSSNAINNISNYKVDLYAKVALSDDGSSYTQQTSGTNGGKVTVKSKYWTGETSISSSESNSNTSYTEIKYENAVKTGTATWEYSSEAANYEFVKWAESVGGNAVSNTGSWRVTGTRTLFAHFRKLYKASTAVNGNIGGTVTTSGTYIKGTYMRNNSALTINVLPDTGYELETVKIKNDSTNVETTVNASSFSNNSYSGYSMPTSNVTVTAYFKKKNYNLTFAQPEHGSIKYNNSTTSPVLIEHGTSNVDVVITPDNGYKIASLEDNNNTITAAEGANSSYTYTIDSFTAAHTITATMEPDLIVLTKPEISIAPAALTTGLSNSATLTVSNHNTVSASAGFHHYALYRGDSETPFKTFTGSSYTLTSDAENNTTFYVRAVTNNTTSYQDSEKSDGASLSVTKETLVKPSVSIEPSSLIVGLANTATLTVSNHNTVSASAGFDHYALYRGDSETPFKTFTGSSYTLTSDAENNTTFYVRAVTDNTVSYNDSAKSDGASLSVAKATLSAPTNVRFASATVTASPTGTATLQWNTVENAGSYEVYKGSSKIATVTTNSCSIDAKYSNTANYTVKAVPSNTISYNTSPSSSAASLTVNRTNLLAPDISLNKSTANDTDTDVTVTVDNYDNLKNACDFTLNGATASAGIDNEGTFTLTAYTTVKYSGGSNSLSVTAELKQGMDEYYTVDGDELSADSSAVTLTVYKPIYSLCGKVNRLVGGPSSENWTAYNATFAINTPTDTPGVYRLTFTTKSDSGDSPYLGVYKNDAEGYAQGRYAFRIGNTYYNKSGNDYSITDDGIADEDNCYVQVLDSGNPGGSIKFAKGKTYTITIDQTKGNTGNPKGKITITDSQWAIETTAYFRTFNLQSNTYSAAQEGSTGGTVPGSVLVTKGDSTTLTATPASDYDFVGWYSSTTFTDANRVSTTTDYTFTPGASGAYYALFKKHVDYRTVTLSADTDLVTASASYNNSTITPGSGTLTVPVGATVTYSVNHKTGCAVDSIAPSELSLTEGTDKTFVMPSTNTTIEVTAHKILYNLTGLVSPNHGSVTFYDRNDNQRTEIQKATYQQTVYVEYIPADGYVLQSFSISGSDAPNVTRIGETNVGYFTMWAEAATVTANVILQYDVTYYVDMHDNAMNNDVTVTLLSNDGIVLKDKNNQNCSKTLTISDQQQGTTVYAATIHTPLTKSGNNYDPIKIQVTHNGKTKPVQQLGTTQLGELISHATKEVWLEAVNEPALTQVVKTSTHTATGGNTRRIYLAKPKSWGTNANHSGWTTIGIYTWGTVTSGSFTYGGTTHMTYLGCNDDYFYYYADVDKTVDNFLFCGWSKSDNFSNNDTPNAQTTNITGSGAKGNFYTLGKSGNDYEAAKGEDAVIPGYTRYVERVSTNVLPSGATPTISVAPTAFTGAKLAYETSDSSTVSVNTTTGIITPSKSTYNAATGEDTPVNITVTIYSSIGALITEAVSGVTDSVTYTIPITVHDPSTLSAFYIMSVESAVYTVNIPTVEVDGTSYQPGYFDMENGRINASVVVTGIQGVASAANSAIITPDSSVNVTGVGDRYISYTVKYAKPNSLFNNYDGITLTGAATTKSIHRDNGERFGFDHWERRNQPNSAPESVTYSTSKKIENAVETLETTQMVFDPAYTVYSAIFTNYLYVDVNFIFDYFEYDPQVVEINEETHETRINYPYDAGYAGHEDPANENFAASHKQKSFTVDGYEVRGLVSTKNTTQGATKINANNLMAEAVKALGARSDHNSELRLNNNYYNYEVDVNGISISNGDDTTIYKATVTVALKQTPKYYHVYVWQNNNWVEKTNSATAGLTGQDQYGYTYQDYADLTVSNAAKWYAVSENDRSTANAPLLATGSNYKFRVKGDTYLVIETEAYEGNFNRSEVAFSHYEVTHRDKTVIVDGDPQTLSLEYLLQNFYIADFFDPTKVLNDRNVPYDEVTFVGGGVVYYSVTDGVPFQNAVDTGYVDSNGTAHEGAIQELLKSKIKEQYDADNLAGLLGEEDAMKVAYGTEIPVTKNVENGTNTGIFYRYLPLEKYTRENGQLVQDENNKYTLEKTLNADTFRYSNTLQSYQYVYASGNENKATNDGKNMRLYSYYVYSYLTYNQDTNLPETKYEVVLSDNYADASTYWAGN